MESKLSSLKTIQNTLTELLINENNELKEDDDTYLTLNSHSIESATAYMYDIPAELKDSIDCSIFDAAEDDDEKIEHDRAILSVFVQPGMSFLGFDDREKFQTATDSIFKDLREEVVSNFATGFQKTSATLEIKILKSDTAH